MNEQNRHFSINYEGKSFMTLDGEK